MTTTIAQCALEWWRADGERSLARLMSLVEFFAESNGDSDCVAYHKQSALGAVRHWEIAQS